MFLYVADLSAMFCLCTGKKRNLVCLGRTLACLSGRMYEKSSVQWQKTRQHSSPFRSERNTKGIFVRYKHQLVHTPGFFWENANYALQVTSWKFCTASFFYNDKYSDCTGSLMIFREELCCIYNKFLFGTVIGAPRKIIVE